MVQALLNARIEAARAAITDAERELRGIVGDGAGAPRAQKVEVSEAVRAAFSRLRAAKTRLTDLEQSVASADLDAARSALGDAEKDLDRVLAEMTVAARAEKTWVTDAVEEAFAKLRAAKERLLDLERSIAPGEG